MSDDATKFSQWCVIELMGHGRIAGFVTEETIAGTALLRVDVPAVGADADARPAFTRYIGGGAIFAMTPVTEAVAKRAADQFRARPLEVVAMPSFSKALPGFLEDEDDDDDSELE